MISFIKKGEPRNLKSNKGMPSENPFPEVCNVRQEGTLAGMRERSYSGMEKGLGPGVGLGKGNILG